VNKCVTLPACKFNGSEGSGSGDPGATTEMTPFPWPTTTVSPVGLIAIAVGRLQVKIGLDGQGGPSGVQALAEPNYPGVAVGQRGQIVRENVKLYLTFTFFFVFSQIRYSHSTNS
jgi:hypothetical protein